MQRKLSSWRRECVIEEEEVYEDDGGKELEPVGKVELVVRAKVKLYKQRKKSKRRKSARVGGCIKKRRGRKEPEEKLC